MKARGNGKAATAAQADGERRRVALDIAGFNNELLNRYSQALLDITAGTLPGSTKPITPVETASPHRPTTQDLLCAFKTAIAEGNAPLREEVNALTTNRLAVLKAQSKGGKKGALAARESRGIDSQRTRIYEAAKDRIDKGEKTEAAFAIVAARFGVTAANVKSIYYREKKKMAGEPRGKYNRKGKKRGRYDAAGHAKR